MAVEPEHDSILVVDANGVEARQVTHEHMQPIPRWHLQIVEPCNRVDLVQLPPNDRPQVSGDAPSGLAC